MTICGWIILIFGVIVFIFVAVAIAVYPKSWYEYCKEHWHWRVKPCWNDGWMFDALKAKFFGLSCLSFGVIAPYCIEKRFGIKCRYSFVDSYVAIWVIFIGTLSWFAIIDAPCLAHNCILLGLFSYRLFEIFQSWVSQYILGGVSEPWKTHNIYRNLVLVFVDYGEVIFSYALLAFILQSNFLGITSWQQSFRYSLGNAVTVGSKLVPTTGIGYALFATQLVFTLLFLVAAVNRIIAAMK